MNHIEEANCKNVRRNRDNITEEKGTEEEKRNSHKPIRRKGDKGRRNH
jgi:hypothetical protein